MCVIVTISTNFKQSCKTLYRGYIGSGELSSGLQTLGIGCSADDPGLVRCGGTAKGNFNFLTAFQCFGWYF